MSKQVINILKLKRNQEIQDVADHNLRQVPSNNVNTSKTKLNRYLVGSPTTDTLAEMSARLAKVPKFRKDAVKVVNLVLSASPEFFENATKKQVTDWENATQKWVGDTFGVENIIYSVVHNDEKTPHFQISFTPIKDGKLNASYWFDGPSKMKKIHNSYAKVNKPFGIKRGEKFNKPSAEDLESYYKKVNASAQYEQKLDKKIDDLFQQFDNPTILQKLNPWGFLDKVAKPLFRQLGKNLSHYRTKAKESDQFKDRVKVVENQLYEYQLKMVSLGLRPNPSYEDCETLRKRLNFVEEANRAVLDMGVIMPEPVIPVPPVPAVPSVPKSPKPRF